MFSTGGCYTFRLMAFQTPIQQLLFQLIMSDLTSCAGSRYNAQDGDMSANSRISILLMRHTQPLTTL